MAKTIYVSRPSMPDYEEYIEAIRPLWDSKWLTNMGEYHAQFESALKEFLKVSEVSLMVNGHMALELVIQAFEFPEGAEVITTPYTFISTTHAIIRNRLKPVFCDIKECDGTIDESKIEELITEKTVAVLPVHVYGHICDVEAIQDIADRHGLKVIYDAAHAFGVTYNDIGIANFGDASIFSFHATKAFNTIEGGAVACNSRELYEKLYDLKNFGIRGKEKVVSIGANAKMNEFCAIMGICNLRHFQDAVKARQLNYARYTEELQDVKGIRILQQASQKHITSNYGYMPIAVEGAYPVTRDELYDRLLQEGIYPRKYFYPLTSDQQCFGDTYRQCGLDTARRLADRILTLPLYEELTLEEVRYITDVIQEPLV